ncbi:MAG: hypothetical protein KKH99_08715, partial [Proteobacteria bacterium]|nr:hypothetical protein [Pseudomonadota bacterium]
ENFPPGENELGELSQDDIDSLLSSNVTAPEPSGEDDEDEDMELISQNDIDQLMNSGALEDDDSAVIAQDLDALSVDVPDDATEDINEDDFEMISQDDINSLMSGSGDTAESEASDPESGPEPDSELDSVAAVIEESAAEPVSDTQVDDDFIDESQSVEIQEALITQQTLDDLIKNFKNEPEPEPEPELEPEPVILDEISEPEAAAEETAALKDTPEVSSDQTADEDDFLIPDTDSGELGSSDNEDVSQDDIDALLLDDEEGQSDDDILISQDDIDTLLMAADQEDEDVLGDLMDDSMDSGLDDDLLDEDIMETEDLELDIDGGDDQVVLEEGGDVAFKPEKQKKKARSASGSASQWYKSKLVIACACALLVLGITVPVAYFIFSSDKPDDPRPVSYAPVAPAPVVVEEPPATAVEREVAIETVDVNVPEPIEYRQSGNMLLQDFVVLASDMTRELAYITADISIDYSDQRAYHEINNNLSYYRDVIYEAISQGLAFEKMEETTEDDILLIVEKALKKVLPEQYIKKVSFKSFKAS